MERSSSFNSDGAASGRSCIGGISTNFGVESTARDAYERSYRPGVRRGRDGGNERRGARVRHHDHLPETRTRALDGRRARWHLGGRTVGVTSERGTGVFGEQSAKQPWPTKLMQMNGIANSHARRRIFLSTGLVALLAFAIAAVPALASSGRAHSGAVAPGHRPGHRVRQPPASADPGRHSPGGRWRGLDDDRPGGPLHAHRAGNDSSRDRISRLSGSERAGKSPGGGQREDVSFDADSLHAIARHDLGPALSGADARKGAQRDRVWSGSCR